MNQRFVFLLLLLLPILGCGKETVQQGASSSSSSMSSFLRVQISVPAAGSYGGAIRIDYNGKSFLVGSKTNQNIKDYIFNLPQGQTFLFQIKGVFDKEKGNFPNPTAEFDVVHISEIQ